MGQIQAGVIPVTAFQQNCTVLFDSDSKAGVVIDPGGDVPAILDVLEKNGITVEAIWLTHGHIDHAGGAMDLKEALGVEVIGPHQDDQSLLDGLEDQARMFGVAESVRNAQPDRWLNEGDQVSFAGHNFEVYHCPGHAPGHVIFFNREAGFAHLGMCCFAGRSAAPICLVATISSFWIRSATRCCHSATMWASSAATVRVGGSVRNASPIHFSRGSNS